MKAIYLLISLLLSSQALAAGPAIFGAGPTTKLLAPLSVTNAPSTATAGSASAISTGEPTTVGITVGGTVGSGSPDAPGSTFFAILGTSVNADTSTGTGTGTAANGAAISGGVLNLAGGVALKNVQWAATGNIDQTQIFTVRALIKPAYSGTPATRQYFWVRSSGSNENGLVQLFHETDGHLNLSLLDSSGGNIGNTDLGAWSPVSGTTYEIEADVNTSAGATRVFIGGTQIGSTQTGTGTSAVTSGVFRVGKTHDASGDVNTAFANFSISYLVVFPTIKHTSNYTAPTSYAANQTADLQRWLSDAGATQAKVGAMGDATFPTLTLTVQGSGSTPACAAANDGMLTFTNGYILCVCKSSAWKKVSDGSTACTF